MSNYNYAPGAIHLDHHKDLNIDVKSVDEAVRLMSTFLSEHAEDVTPDEETNNTPCINHFPYLTKKCLEQKQEDIVEAEIQAARKGTAEDMWRTLWNNENLGYLEIEYVNATTLFRDIEKWYGKLPYKVRNFRDARNKR